MPQITSVLHIPACISRDHKGVQPSFLLKDKLVLEIQNSGYVYLRSVSSKVENTFFLKTWLEIMISLFRFTPLL